LDVTWRWSYYDKTWLAKLDCNMSTWYECKRDLSASLFNNTKSPFTLTRLIVFYTYTSILMIYFKFNDLFQFSCFISIFLFYFNFHVLFQFSCFISILFQCSCFISIFMFVFNCPVCLQFSWHTFTAKNGRDEEEIWGRETAWNGFLCKLNFSFIKMNFIKKYPKLKKNILKFRNAITT